VEYLSGALSLSRMPPAASRRLGLSRNWTPVSGNEC
jgi:hypothetical protein